MRKNEYESLEQFTSQYVGEWNPSGGHWYGLDFVFEATEYRLHTGCMYEDEETLLSTGKEVLFGLYQKKEFVGRDKKEYELLCQYANMSDLLASTVIRGIAFEKVIMDDNTEIVGQD